MRLGWGWGAIKFAKIVANVVAASGKEEEACCKDFGHSFIQVAAYLMH